MDDKEHIKNIINAGILAPSGDNCQPWQFHFDGEKLYLKNLEYRDTSLYNANNIASYLAFGAMIENMDIMAKSLGYSMSEKLFPQGNNASIVGVLHFNKGKEFHDPLLPFLGKRSVNRKKYKSRHLELSARDSLLTVVKKYQGAELYIVEDVVRKKKLAKIISLNDRILFENKNLHEFLFKHLRWSRQAVESSKDGMSIESLELGTFQSKIFRLLSSWNLVRFLNIFGFSRFVPIQSYNLCKGSSALCMLLIEGKQFERFIHGGRAFQRIWLTATSLGLSLHPMTGVIFLLQRLRMTNKEGLSVSHQSILKNSEEKLKQIFPINNSKSMVIAFRLGYAEPPSDKALRLPLDKVFLEGNP